MGVITYHAGIKLNLFGKRGPRQETPSTHNYDGVIFVVLQKLKENGLTNNVKCLRMKEVIMGNVL